MTVDHALLAVLQLIHVTRISGPGRIPRIMEFHVEQSQVCRPIEGQAEPAPSRGAASALRETKVLPASRCDPPGSARDAAARRWVPMRADLEFAAVAAPMRAIDQPAHQRRRQEPVQNRETSRGEGIRQCPGIRGVRQAGAVRARGSMLSAPRHGASRRAPHGAARIPTGRAAWSFRLGAWSPRRAASPTLPQPPRAASCAAPSRPRAASF